MHSVGATPWRSLPWGATPWRSSPWRSTPVRPLRGVTPVGMHSRGGDSVEEHSVEVHSRGPLRGGAAARPLPGGRCREGHSVGALPRGPLRWRSLRGGNSVVGAAARVAAWGRCRGRYSVTGFAARGTPREVTPVAAGACGTPLGAGAG